MPPQATDRDRKRSAIRGAAVAVGLGLLGLAGVALLLASSSTSIETAPAATPGSEEAGLHSEAWIAGWVFVFLALSALYSFERRYRAKLGATPLGRAVSNAAAAAGVVARQAQASANPTAPPHRPIGLLLKKKPAARAEKRPLLPKFPAPRSNPPEEGRPLPRPAGRGAKEAGEESFSVAEAEPLALAAAFVPSPPEPPAPAAAFVPSPEPPPAVIEPTRLERCARLRAEGRFEEAARIAREGLAGEDEPGPLLIELSRAELGLGRVEAAIDTARDAHFASRSRESVSHLIRLLVETRRFSRQDGPTLRRAAARHPGQPLLRHAVGVFESMYGEAHAAQQELREALRLEADADRRAAIERDLAQVQGRLHG